METETSKLKQFIRKKKTDFFELNFITSIMIQTENLKFFKKTEMEEENLMEKLPMLQIEYNIFGHQLSANWIYLEWEMYQSGVYLEFKSWAEDLLSRAQHLLRQISIVAFDSIAVLRFKLELLI